jgi:hypothetical protein
MNRLVRFFRLRRDERTLFVRALALVALVRAGLWLLPFRRLESLLKRWEKPSVRRGAPPAERIAWAVQAASRYVPRSTCLVQALAGGLLCRRAGFTVDVHIGVARGPAAGLDAHAWLASDGRVLLGDEELERYTRLLTLGGERS